VVHLARIAPRYHAVITDLLQEVICAGLLDAARYRPESIKTFGAYATWWIRRAINRAISEHSQSMRSGELYNPAIQKCRWGQRQLTEIRTHALASGTGRVHRAFGAANERSASAKPLS